MLRTRLQFGLMALIFAIGVGLGSGVALAYQVHMQNALGDLNAAYHQLQVAIPDKAGHRVQAMSLVSQAISQVQAGIAAGV
ncbi:MAG TPA: hypothetical protein VIN40_02175 [Candidatus Tyrphobacter sp.]